MSLFTGPSSAQLNVGLTLLAASVFLALAGAGRYSLDALIGRQHARG